MPKVGIITGSKSDLPVVERAQATLKDFGIESDITVASAHRTPKKVEEYASSAEGKYDVIIAAAGMAAALPGCVAAQTILPVIGIPVHSKALSGHDALFAIVQMPSGVPVATVAIDGAKNAAILAVQIMALKYPELKEKLKAYKKKLQEG
ncbi:5-(carboxyamino)imidazole ribonucleotide mutase [candidate division WOR-1 bacterium RIFOXYB2_FULL_42_35]|uniref:N5-carboxyaminoimidazole ribonucleotide mutase n=1 Tax=candidate division WOR-1 bacterium RIFOXYC2_FULL_41_25 TaxID=1802586 RepID=A0A1F4TKQ8_UNCSA|nr:MAG: 5-(carboxyamino)imidazole ribonucleotide mutase [candidate division WOR-1 bacterium RIFOXYA2_FULL_41_14]OGC22432.1 MAG: 5-(carboxyamino)imidazole ribonucleotide mutase [candidate division WOR-1 bacterium RIFOXYB2_FULL_42_35]OGC33110.1 MAG: 5-(carboxyamino)imidazole ribonucleotide mutase [candidate division WOR-1 bacterium RIFOXYC2_FULL_41_25]OGC43426.1 MAG: 5-(carboxyamino)imidazole ribonucleotide mutase [candidate division WOR-1 bacterium RIFOXYD2_FULL_41_8]